MVLRYQTLNSVYEIDPANKRIRRVEGTNPPTAHFEPDGTWKDYSSVHPNPYAVRENEALLVFWPGENWRTTRLSPLMTLEIVA